MGYDPFGTFDLWEFLRGAGNIITGSLAIVTGTIVLIGGAKSGTEGKMILEPGMELDRYGADHGRYLTNPGTHYSKLNLPPSNNLILSHYKVLKPFKVSTGIVKGGGGFQYFTWRSVKKLVQLGYLVAI